jgi:hypothetical protein
MLVKVSEASGVALDWMVKSIECEGCCADEPLTDDDYYSTDWAQGGPIIERELLDLHSSSGGDWTVEKWEYEVTSGGGTNTYIAFGPTPLIAAMRCYVASKLGEEVEVPDELAN